MPQLSGDLVFSAGTTGKLHALNARTGELVWRRDLCQELDAKRAAFGYSSHPLLYKDRLLVAVGGKKNAVAALEQKSGRTIWAKHSLGNVYSSPIVVNDGTRDQVVVLAARHILGLDPVDGSQLWLRSLSTDPGAVFATTPLWHEEGKILVLAGHSGAKALRITAVGAEPQAELVWSSNKLRPVFSNMLLAGDVIYAARGSYGPGLLTSIDINTGQPRWSSRGFANANLIQADGKIILLDEEGWLTLAKPHANGVLDILSRTRVLSHNAWTVPTLSGTTLYLRDRKVIMALNVGATRVSTKASVNAGNE